MSDPTTADPAHAPPVRDEDGALTDAFVAAVAAAVDSGDRAALTALAAPLGTADTADLIGALEPEQRVAFVRLLGDDFDFTVLTELDETIRVAIVEELNPKEVAEGVADLDSDDAVYILEDLDEPDRQEILSEIPVDDRVALQRSLTYPEESAGRRMRTEFVAVPPFWTVGQTIDHMRGSADLPDDFHEIFVVDAGFRLLGTVRLDRLLRTKRPVTMGMIMETTRHLIRVDEDQEDVARQFQRYDLVSAAVVDEAERLVGVLTVDDIVDVIQEEADEDLKRLVGVRDEEISDSILTSSRSRLPWLAINAVTAFLAAGVIGLLGGTITQMVELAVLMPIVSALGGSTGSQAMAVTVRAIATGELSRRNRRRIVFREALVGFINGIAIALLVGLAAALWFSNPKLGAVIGAALTFNMLVAGLAGVSVPLVLDRLGFDPAVASAVFVTTVTDVMGFFAFLGLAGLSFGLF